MNTSEQRLRQRGLQVTAQRIAVLAAVTRRPHATADQIADVARAEIGAISRQAVYDALRILTENNLVRRVQPAGSPALFDPRVGDNHHHVICRICGRTEDVDCVTGEPPCLAGGHDEFIIDEAEVIYWGTCRGCRQSSAPAGEPDPATDHA